MNGTDNLFLNYLADNYDDAFRKIVFRYIIRHRELIENKLSDMCYLGYLDETDIDLLEYKTVYIESKGESIIEFDVVISPIIYCPVTYKKSHDHDVESVSNIWLIISCKAKIDEDLRDFKIIGIDEYAKHQSTKPLAGDLVPIIYKNEYDKYATEILEKFYPEALSKATCIDTEILAKKMGLNILKRPISKDGTIFGQIYFQDCEAEFYNCTLEKPENVHIHSNTIVIDKNANSYFSMGSENITIVHECVHSYLHREAFNFARMIDKNLSKIQCQSDDVDRGVKVPAGYTHMEIQANAIAPHILMPTKTLLEKYHGLEELYMVLQPDLLDSIENIVRDIAKFFNVSIYAARKRLIEVGIDTVIGTFNWVDDNYIRPYMFKKGSLAENETYTVKFQDVHDKVSKDAYIYAMTYSGALVFVENHLCINSEKYIADNCLTEYARHHMDECCVKFKFSTSNNILKHNNYESVCYLCREFGQDLRYELELADNKDFYKHPEIKKFYSESRARITTIKSIISNKKFSEILKYFMGELDIDVNSLAIDSKIDESTIRKWLKGTQIPEKRSVIAICIALQLPNEIIEIVLRQAHVSFAEGDNDDDALRNALTFSKNKTVEQVNAYLKSIGASPLTKN